jgi:hypothetical protein
MSIRIRYTCPHCHRRIVHHPELAGHLVICSACKGEFYEPTDPLPGKPAEQALEPMPETPRRLRVPEGNNPRHDLALLARRDASDLRTITEIVEAVLLDDNPPLPVPQTGNAPKVPVEETIHDFGYTSQPESGQDRPKPAIPSWEPPSKPKAFPGPGSSSSPAEPSTPTPSAPTTAARSQQMGLPGQAPTTNLAGATVHPLVPTMGVPSAVVATPPAARSLPKPAVPVASASKSAPDRPLAGLSVKQMTEELRRRGLGVAVVTCDMNPMRNFELGFSDNMTREDALALLRKYLETLREVKSTEKPGLLKRMWKKGQNE